MGQLTQHKATTALMTAEHSEAIRVALKSSLYPGASDASVDLVLAYCHAAGLDPMTKPVHIVPMKVSTGRKNEDGYDIKETRDVVMPGIGLYRINAARTGQYAGCSEPEYGPTRTLTFTREVWENVPNSNRRTKRNVEASIEYPEWCRITVRKLLGNTVVEFTALEYWLENYATKGHSTAPNEMWGKRPFAQLAKCTEAQAIRKAFPEAVGSQPTAEEMEGKAFDIDVDDTPRQATPALAMPQAKPAATPAGEVVDAEFTETQQPAAEKPLVIELGAGPLKLLLAKARSAGCDAENTEEALLARFGRIDMSNLNDVLAQLVA